jgi:stage V sporulation protein B
MSKQTFIRGTLILIAAGFITKILGFVNRIVIARIMGEEGVGLYMMAVPTLLLAITLTQLGLPVAISKLVAEASAVQDKQRIKRILVVSLTITAILSIVFTLLLVTLAPLLSTVMFTDPRTLYPLLAISPIIPIVAISAVLRGYFQGIQNMRPSAISQVIEQITRIALVAVCTNTLLPYGVEFAASGAMISAVCGELASLLYMYIVFKRSKDIKLRENFQQTVQSGKKTFHDLMKISLPTTGGRLIGSISYFFEPIVVAQSLAIAGVASSVATKQYGELTGYALPLLLLPSFISYALSTSLVPSISEALAKKHKRLIEFRLQQAMRFSFIAGGWSALIMFVFAAPILELMYGTDKTAIYIHMMAPCFIFFYLQGPLQAILQALDLANAAMINSLVGNIVKIACIFILVSRPEFQIMGAAIAICVGMLTVTFLHFATVLKAMPFTIYIREYILTILAIVLAGSSGSYLYHHITLSSSLLIQTISWVMFTTLCYILLLCFFKLIRKEELKKIPFLKKVL